MKDVRMILPSPASDTAGAASALFELGGLSVIHDAAGSMESYITFDEGRDLEGKRTTASRLSRLEAITGDDSILLDKLARECDNEAPNFVAIIGSPIPFTIGTDLDGIAAEAELITGVPSFAVNTGGFEQYDRGVGEALVKLIEKLAKSPREHAGRTVNLLGATPMDYSPAEIEGLRAELLARGFDRVHTLTMTNDLDEIRRSSEAECNLVISIAGLPAARFMQKKFGIPYTIGVPTGGEPTTPAPLASEKTVLVLGEAVLTRQLTKLLLESGIHAVAGIIGNDDPEIFPEVPGLRLDTEKSIREELKKDYFAVVADPLYKLLLRPNSAAKYIERPHRALSARLYPYAGQTLSQLIATIKEVF